ncbi:MAG: glycosyltransferase, partial [Candidatus Omnitrophota bacterium]
MNPKQGYKHTLSVVTLTRNNSAKLRDCLQSVKWADEIVIVDDNSKDNSREIAKEYTNNINIRAWENEGV